LLKRFTLSTYKTKTHIGVVEHYLLSLTNKMKNKNTPHRKYVLLIVITFVALSRK